MRAQKDDFRTKNLEAWERVLNSIFSAAIPERKVWTDRRSIITILRKMSVRDLTHVFFPDGGGLDLDGAKEGVEPECIELDTGIPTILKPRELAFESFGDEHYEWAYFRIEAIPLAPSGVYKTLEGPYEELTEIRPGNYIVRSALDAGEYEEGGRVRRLPESARGLMRYLSGAFVIFAKGSLYNRNPHTYDGRHAKMTAKEFHAHVAKAIRVIGDASRVPSIHR